MLDDVASEFKRIVVEVKTGRRQPALVRRGGLEASDAGDSGCIHVEADGRRHGMNEMRIYRQRAWILRPRVFYLSTCAVVPVSMYRQYGTSGARARYSVHLQ